MFLLDTNVISELRRRDRSDRNVVAWASAIPVTNFFISVISILEIELGAQLMACKDVAQGTVLRTWIDQQVLRRFDGRIIAIDASVAQRSASLHVPNPRPDRDALIAATALVHGLTVVTRNIADFDGTGVALINPWLPAPG